MNKVYIEAVLRNKPGARKTLQPQQERVIRVSCDGREHNVVADSSDMSRLWGNVAAMQGYRNADTE